MSLLNTLQGISGAFSTVNDLLGNINNFGSMMNPQPNQMSFGNQTMMNPLNVQTNFPVNNSAINPQLLAMNFPTFASTLPNQPLNFGQAQNQQINQNLLQGALPTFYSTLQNASFNPSIANQQSQVMPQLQVMTQPMQTTQPMQPMQTTQPTFADRLRDFSQVYNDFLTGQAIAGKASLDPSSGDQAFVDAMGLQNVQNQATARNALRQQAFENQIKLRNAISNQEYKDALIKNLSKPEKPKIESLQGGVFSQVEYPDGRIEIIRNDEVADFVEEQEKQKRLDKTGGLNLTAGQKKVDEVFAKDFITNQDKLLNDKVNLGKITGIMQEIADPDFDATGSLTQKTPLLEDFQKFGKDGQKRLDLSDRVRNVVQQSLRTILGAAFTEKEGNALIASYYNPALPEKFNQRRLAELRTQLKEKTDYLDARNNYFIEKGTLRDFNLQPPSAENIRKEALRIYNETTKGIKNETDKEIESKEDSLVDKLLNF